MDYERLQTKRLLLRKPRVEDAEAIYARYASDEEVGRYMSWPVHESIEDTYSFLEFSDAEWQRWPVGPYVVESLEDGTLLGGTGIAFETEYRASTGYVFARDSWGYGYATEALAAVVSIAAEVGLQRLYALCHPDHTASWRVLEKCGFAREGILRRYMWFPNIMGDAPLDVLCYSRVFDETQAEVH